MTENNPNPSNPNPGATDGTGAAGGAQPTPAPATNPGNGADANANPTPEPVNSQPAGAEDFKTKFSESTRENQRLMELMKQNGIDPETGKAVANASTEATQQNAQMDTGDNPMYFTDEELEATFPSFSTMTSQEKEVLRNVGGFPKMARMVAEMHDKLTFNEQLEVLKTDPANAIIAENEKEFKEFAYKDDNLKLPLDVLKDAFIGRKLREGNAPAAPAQPAPKAPGMEDGSAGQTSTGDATIELTPQAARELRTKDQRKYNKLARAGKIKIVNQ